MTHLKFFFFILGLTLWHVPPALGAESLNQLMDAQGSPNTVIISSKIPNGLCQNCF